MTDISDLEAIRQKHLAIIRRVQSTPQETLAIQEIKERETDRELKKMYAKRWFWVVVVQLAFVNLAFVYFLVWCQLDVNTVRVFLGAVLAESFGIVLVITRSLFPRK